MVTLRFHDRQGLIGDFPKMASETFGVILKRLREEKGLTQQQLADAIDVKREQITRLEAGPVDPKFSTVKALASALGCDVNAFDPPKKPTKSKPTAGA
jgi:transcriptional regulator with XRE-family HTH domain